MELVDEFCDFGTHHGEDMRSSPSGEGVNGPARDFAQISLDVLIGNDRTVKLYRSRGFEVLRIVDDDSYTMLRRFHAP